VFVDDNPLELEQVKSAYPTMECIQFREDDARFLTGLRDRFAKREIREEDRLRVESLRTGGAVLQAAGNPASLDALLAGAEARIVVRWGKQPPDARALELINKTNQFNLNGERFDEADWNAYLADSSTHLALVEYEDRFGKLGRIAVLAGREREGRFDLDIWVMSCRAFSRRIEYQCLKVLLGRWETVRLRFVPTERNGPIRQFIGEVAPELAVRRDEFDSRCPPLYHQTESDYGQYSTTG